MQEDRSELELVDKLVAELIGEAVLAGAYSEVIRRQPETTAGFGKLRDRHSARVAALAGEISAAAGLADRAATRSTAREGQ